MIVIADDREDIKRLAFAEEFFTKLGYTFKIGHNTMGDYVLYKNDVPIVAIEYKSTKDFIGSIIDKRVFNQARDIAENFKKHFVFIEEYCKSYIIQNIQWYGKNAKKVMSNCEGAVMSLNQVTTVVECSNQGHAFHRMHLAFQKATDGRNRQLTKVNKKYDTLVSFLLCIRDIGESIATSIVNELKLKCLYDLFQLNMKRLCLVDGVGVKTAEKVLIKVFGNDWEERQYGVG
nr:ERCC4 domain-containing protein [Methanobrevibacter arboriphilus]